MIKTKQLQQIISSWATSLDFNVRIHLFGSFLKGKSNPSDIDISLEILDSISKGERTGVWCKYHKTWETHLSELIGMKAHLVLYEDDAEYMPQNLKESSLLLYDSTEKE